MESINIEHMSADETADPIQFQVEVVSEDMSKTHHSVSLSKELYARLTGGLKSPEQLVRASFEFLLERESKESILPTFDLSEIQKYYPEYETLISSNSP